MELLPEIVKILCEDSILVAGRLKFVHALGISETVIAPFMKLHDMGHCRPYDLVNAILSEWIATKKDSATIAELRRILTKIDLNRCSHNLSNLEKLHPGPIKIPGIKTFQESGPHSSRNPPPKNCIDFGVKDPVWNFMGRDQELAMLKNYFQSPAECRSILLTGLGGMGKTELAKKFTQSISESQVAKCWLVGESPVTLLNSITQICLQLRLSTKDSEGEPLGIQKLLQNILSKLQSEYTRWLVVIDNVDDTHREFQTALETISAFGPFVFLLVISRRKDISPGEYLEVTEFKLEDSVKFIKNSLKITDPSSEEPILALCEQLSNFPLALNHSMAYIKQQQRQTQRVYGVQNYLDALGQTQILDTENAIEGYPEATLKVWHLTLQKFEENQGADDRMALDLLNSMAFIVPDNHQTSTLQKLFKRFYGKHLDQIHSCLKKLLQYSLVSSSNSSISIHPLVQLALRRRMASESNQDNQTRDAELLTSFWTSLDPNEWKPDEMANIVKIWKHSCNHPVLHQDLAYKSEFVSIQLNNMGLINESYDFATECCKFLLDLRGPEDKGYVLMNYTLAVAMWEKGHFESCLEKFTFVYGKLKELCGEEDKDTLTAGHLISRVLAELGRYKESLKWSQTVFRSKVRVQGDMNESTNRTRQNVAVALLKSGKGEEALKMFQEILAWEEMHFGKDHPETFNTRLNIGSCFLAVRKHPEARDCFQDVIYSQEKQLGGGHPHVFATKGLLAQTFEALGEIGRALKIMEEVVEAKGKELGPDDPWTVAARDYVTKLYKNKQK